MKCLRRIVASLQILFLSVALIPTVGSAKNEEVHAAVSGITNNGTYQIVSAYNGRAITQTDMSTFYANAVVWNTSALSDLAKWTVTERGEYYSLTNIVSGKSMKIMGNSTGSNCDLNGYDNSNNYKWKLVPVTKPGYTDCFYIVSAVKNSDGGEEYAEITGDYPAKDQDGAQVRLWTYTDGETRQMWRFVPTSASDSTFTESMNNTALNAFKDQYYKTRKTGYTSLGEGFWGIAEVMEAMLDGYETTGIALYKDLFVGTYNDFIARNGDYWTNNNYNDDISWAAIASVRAYLLFGDQRYLDIAKKNFDFMYNRASTYGGGLLRWCEEADKRSTSNACINGPATVCACYLAIATGDSSYWDKARTVYMAQRNSNLYEADGDGAGRVNDCIREDGSVQNNWVSTYNQGTYLGSATMLYEHFGDQMYYNDAQNIANYTLKHLCYDNILKEENTNSGDLSGMRGILVRYLRKYAVDFNKGNILDFFKKNTKLAWMNRNSKNLIQSPWQKKTPENVDWDEFAGYNAISLMANMPTYSDSLVKNAYSTIEAEDLDYCKGLISENSNGTSNGRSLGGVQNNFYSAYYNVDFGSVGASSVTFRYSKATEREGAQGRIEIRLGSTSGTLIGTAYLDNTGGWGTWSEATAEITKTTGLQNIYLVYKTDTSYVCNLDCLTFNEAITYRNAFDKIEAESHDDQSGIVDDPNPGNIGGVNNNDWVKYDYVKFGETAKSLSIRYSVDGNSACGYASVYLDSMDNSPVCVAKLDATAYGNWSTYVTDKFDLSSNISSGIHTVYIKFTTAEGKGHVANVDYFKFCNDASVLYNTGINIEGFQLSTVVGGTRTIGSIEPKINNKEVTEWGFIYGLFSVNGENLDINDSDMILKSNSDLVYSYASTPIGTMNAIMGSSKTATYYSMTMTYGEENPIAFTAGYKIRAYAKLEDGTRVYSNTAAYSVFSIAKALYEGGKMNSLANHEYLYDTILKVCDPTIEKVDYNWRVPVVTP